MKSGQTKEKHEDNGDARELKADFQSSESNIGGAGGKREERANINQSVHLVGSHMADQHTDGANLLILCNGVQLILLAVFISRTHT